MPSIALVLGAGGVVGGAYEAGALAAVHAVTGWDPRRAGLIVGTSAGATIGSMLRIGFAARDLEARVLAEPLSDEGRTLARDLPEDPLRLPGPPELRGIPIPLAPWLVVPAVLQRGPVRPMLAVAGWLPRGSHPTEVVGRRIRALVGDRWPDDALWICAARVRDGRRVVFGRDDVVTPDLATAVEASSAVCGYFAPVSIGGVDHVDGGIHSVSNLDLVAGLGFDLAVCISPMSTVPADPPWSPRRAVRAVAAGLLGWEIGRVEGRGTKVLDLSPTPDDVERFGADLLDHGPAPDVARAARRSVEARLADLDGTTVALLSATAAGHA